MVPTAIGRRLFVVPLANDKHGKTHLVLAVVNQGERRQLKEVHRGARSLTSPWGRVIDALIFPRSYQETLAGEFKSVEAALVGVDPDWQKRDLVILPSHLHPSDCTTILDLAHGAGFDAVAVAVLLNPDELRPAHDCLSLPWDERWTVSNDRVDGPDGQVMALGNDLWVWVASAIENR